MANKAKLDQIFQRANPAQFARESLAFTPDPDQLPVLDPSIRRGILNCSRQWGKSAVIAARAVHHAFHNPDSLTLILTPSARQSRMFLRKASTFLRKLNIKRKGDGDNEMSLLLPNGARLVGLPANKDTSRGFSGVSLLLVDEASRVEDELFNSIYPSIAACPNATVWLMSTPNGRQGFFYRSWINEDPEYRKFAIPATKCPRIGAKIIEEQRRILTVRDFEQEYMCQFHDAAGAVFSMDTFNKCLRTDLLPMFPGISITSYRARTTSADYERTLKGEPYYFIGVDLGQQCDHTAIAIIERLSVCKGRSPVDWEPVVERTYILRHIEQLPIGTPYTTIVETLKDLTHLSLFKSRTTIVVDSTGVGLPVFEQICNKIQYASKVSITITSGATQNNNNVPKRSLVTHLTMCMESGQLQLPATLTNLTPFTNEVAGFRSRINQSGYTTFEAPPREHDDMVVAVCLAAFKGIRL